MLFLSSLSLNFLGLKIIYPLLLKILPISLRQIWFSLILNHLNEKFKNMYNITQQKFKIVVVITNLKRKLLLMYICQNPCIQLITAKYILQDAIVPQNKFRNILLE